MRHAVGGWSRCTAGGDVPAPASPARSLPGAAVLAAVTSVFPSHRRFTNGGTPRAPAARSARQGRPPSPTGPLGFLQCRGGPDRGRCCHPGSVQWGSSSAKSLLGFLSYSFPPKVFILFLKTKFKKNFFSSINGVWRRAGASNSEIILARCLQVAFSCHCCDHILKSVNVKWSVT